MNIYSTIAACLFAITLTMGGMERDWQSNKRQTVVPGAPRKKGLYTLQELCQKQVAKNLHSLRYDTQNFYETEALIDNASEVIPDQHFQAIMANPILKPTTPQLSPSFNITDTDSKKRKLHAIIKNQKPIPQRKLNFDDME